MRKAWRKDADMNESSPQTEEEAPVQGDGGASSGEIDCQSEDGVAGRKAFFPLRAFI